MDSDGTKIATGVHEVLEMLKLVVDTLSIPEKENSGRALQRYVAGAGYM